MKLISKSVQRMQIEQWQCLIYQYKWYEEFVINSYENVNENKPNVTSKPMMPPELVETSCVKVALLQV